MLYAPARRRDAPSPLLSPPVKNGGGGGVRHGRSEGGCCSDAKGDVLTWKVRCEGILYKFMESPGFLGGNKEVR